MECSSKRRSCRKRIEYVTIPIGTMTDLHTNYVDCVRFIGNDIIASSVRGSLPRQFIIVAYLQSCENEICVWFFDQRPMEEIAREGFLERQPWQERVCRKRLLLFVLF